MHVMRRTRWTGTQTTTTLEEDPARRFSGGVINAITKSGGNVFSGGFRANMRKPTWTAGTPTRRRTRCRRRATSPTTPPTRRPWEARSCGTASGSSPRTASSDGRRAKCSTRPASATTRRGRTTVTRSSPPAPQRTRSAGGPTHVSPGLRRFRRCRLLPRNRGLRLSRRSISQGYPPFQRRGPCCGNRRLRCRRPSQRYRRNRTFGVCPSRGLPTVESARFPSRPHAAPGLRLQSLPGGTR